MTVARDEMTMPDPNPSQADGIEIVAPTDPHYDAILTPASPGPAPEVEGVHLRRVEALSRVLSWGRRDTMRSGALQENLLRFKMSRYWLTTQMLIVFL